MLNSKSSTGAFVVDTYVELQGRCVDSVYETKPQLMLSKLRQM